MKIAGPPHQKTVPRTLKAFPQFSFFGGGGRVILQQSLSFPGTFGAAKALHNAKILL